MKLVWTASGDEIEVTPYDEEFAEYYVQNLNKHNKNSFHLKWTKIENSLPEQLERACAKVNELMKKFQIDPLPVPTNLLDQQQLNELHVEWVDLGVRNPNVISALRLLGEDKVDLFRDVNMLIHRIEKMFAFNASNFDSDPWMIPNTFGTDVLSFDTANITIVYNNLGRQQYDRFINYDLSWKGRDEMSTLSGELEVNLSRPEPRSASSEFIKWCEEQDQKPVGIRCCLGNFKDIENRLAYYRAIFLNNVKHEGNDFTIEI